MAYKPRTLEVARILSRAYGYVQSVAYTVTARWLFYRLLQDGSFHQKADYKRLLGYLSKARKGFYGRWHPSTLADDTRRPIVRGGGYDNGGHWYNAYLMEVDCVLDKWRRGQENYVEIWFEASAMEAQFRFHAHRYIPLLAFRGDVSIPAKWACAVRIARRWLELHLPVKILYYGDLDPKGITIPQSANRDIFTFVLQAIYEEIHDPDDHERPEDCECESEAYDEFAAFGEGYEFIRKGLNPEQIAQYNVPENPERPGTYQWEGVDDATAAALIGEASEYLNEEAFLEAEDVENGITDRFRDHLGGLAL